jgi:hypothetical protein
MKGLIGCLMMHLDNVFRRSLFGRPNDAGRTTAFSRRARARPLRLVDRAVTTRTRGAPSEGFLKPAVGQSRPKLSIRCGARNALARAVYQTSSTECLAQSSSGSLPNAPASIATARAKYSRARSVRLFCSTGSVLSRAGRIACSALSRKYEASATGSPLNRREDEALSFTDRDRVQLA